MRIRNFIPPFPSEGYFKHLLCRMFEMADKYERGELAHQRTGSVLKSMYLFLNLQNITEMFGK